jgi:putative ABC transport system permease protein
MASIKLALRNILANPRFYVAYILVLTLLAFAFTTLLSLAINASLIYSKAGSEELLAVFEDNRACPLASLVPESYGNKIKNVPHVEEVTGEVRHMIVYAPRKGLTLAGVEPEKFRDFKNIKIPDDHYRAFAEDPLGAIVGRKTQRIFNWKVGEPVTFQAIQFNLRGVFELPLSIYDGMIVFQKDYLQDLIKKEGYFTAFTVKIDSPQNKTEVCRAVEELLADHPSGIICRPETEFWGRTERQIGDFGRNMRGLVTVFALLVFAVMANASALSLRGRRRQVETLEAAGFGRGRRFAVLLIEPVAAALIAGIGGGLVAFLVWMKQPTLGGVQAILPPVAVTPLNVLLAVLVLLVLASIPASVFAYRISRH